MSEKKPFEGWCIVELMGHRRLAGHVSEQEIAGAAFVRLDVPGAKDQTGATQFYAPAAVYCITPTTEDIARRVATSSQPAPVQRWELAAPREEATDAEAFDDDGEEDEDDQGRVDP